MNKKYYLLATEGPHDQAAITKLLELSGLKVFKGSKKALDPFWYGLIPTYPPVRRNGEEDLYARLIMPSFLQSDTHSVAVYWGEGTNLIKNVIALTINNKHYIKDIQAFGLIIDADDRASTTVAEEKAKELQIIFPSISHEPGTIAGNLPKTGIYVLPDNIRQGTLDSILLNCASIMYPNHKKGAQKFIDELDDTHKAHLLQNWRLKEKALVACIVGVIKPGAANTPSIAQDKWICDYTLDSVDDIERLYSFLKDLLDLSSVQVQL